MMEWGRGPQPSAAPYKAGTHEELLKWKFASMNSVDFLLRKVGGDFGVLPSPPPPPPLCPMHTPTATPSPPPPTLSGGDPCAPPLHSAAVTSRVSRLMGQPSLRRSREDAETRAAVVEMEGCNCAGCASRPNVSHVEAAGTQNKHLHSANQTLLGP